LRLTLLLTLLVLLQAGGQPPARSGRESADPPDKVSQRKDGSTVQPMPGKSPREAEPAEKRTPLPPREPTDKPSEPLPADVILAVCNNLSEALRRMPQAIVLTPQKYRQLLDRIAQLEKQLERTAPITPSVCAIRGKVEGNLAHLTITFQFEADQPNRLIRLACNQGLATSIRQDGKTPRLIRAGGPTGATGPATREETEEMQPSEGFLLQTDRQGEQEAVLELLLPVTNESGGPGFVLELPRAAVTKLDLQLPSGVRDIRVGGQPLASTLLRWTAESAQLSGPLGAVERLDVQWRSPMTAAATAVPVADGTINVFLEPKVLRSVARLTLGVQGGQIQQWRLLVPLKARVQIHAADQPRVARIEPVDLKTATLVTVHLKEPAAEPLNLTVEQEQPPPLGQRPAAAIGPFHVLGAARQSGSLLVSSLAPDWHLQFQSLGDLTRRPLTAEELRREGLVAAFRYGPVGVAVDPASLASGRVQPWLNIEADPVAGQIKAQPHYLFRLAASGGSDAPRWLVQATFTVTPRWADLDRFAVQLPKGCEWIADGSYPISDPVRSLRYDPSRGIVEFQLARRKSSDSTASTFTVRVEALYPELAVPEKKPGQAVLALPRPVAATEFEGKVTVQVGTDLEVFARGAANPQLEWSRPTPHELQGRFARRSPSQIDISWQPYRPPVRVASTADITLLPGEVRVEQELRYTPLQSREGPATSRVMLLVPRAVGNTLEVVSGGRLLGLTDLGDTQRASVATNGGSAPTLLLRYRMPRSALTRNPTPREVRKGQKEEGTDRPIPLVEVPLVIPEQVTETQGRVRLWSEAGRLPRLVEADSGWTEQPLEIVPGQIRLPVLVASNDRLDQPLLLQQGGTDALEGVLVERALVQVELLASGVELYRVRYRLSRLANASLEVELPGSPTAIGLQVQLAGRQVDPEWNPAATPEGTGRRNPTVRLRLPPQREATPTILEIAYRLESQSGGRVGWSRELVVPQLLGGVDRCPTRWAITVPSEWVVLGPEPGLGLRRRWGFRGWWLAGRVATTVSDLESWLHRGADAGATAAAATSEANQPALVLWQDGPESLTLWAVGQQPWLLGCSLVVVLLGWLLSGGLALRRSGGTNPSLRWRSAVLLLVLVVLPILVIAGFYPLLLMQVVYGCQPGLIVLGGLTAVRWLLDRRQQRRVVFLPSFRRRTGSSLVRNEAVGRREPAVVAAEPSTTDAPPPSRSSSEQSGGAL